MVEGKKVAGEHLSVDKLLWTGAAAYMQIFCKSLVLSVLAFQPNYYHNGPEHFSLPSGQFIPSFTNYYTFIVYQTLVTQ